MSSWGPWANACKRKIKFNCFGERRVRSCPWFKSKDKICNRNEVTEYRPCTKDECRNGTISHLRYKRYRELGENESWTIITSCSLVEGLKSVSYNRIFSSFFSTSFHHFSSYFHLFYHISSLFFHHISYPTL